MTKLAMIKSHFVINRDAYLIGALTGAFVWGCVYVHHDLKSGGITIKVSRENVE